MTIFVRGHLASVRLDICPDGGTRLIGDGRSGLSYNILDRANDGMKDLEKLMPNIRSSYDDVQLCHLTNIPTNWILVPAEGAATGLGGASELHRRVESAPAESHAAIKLLTGHPEFHPNCISVIMAIPDRQFASFLEAFKVVFCTPDARYHFHLGDFYGFEDAAEGSDSAMTAAQLLAGKPLIISPATVSLQVRPPKRRKSRDGSAA